jgi:hypothetical protein
MHLKSQGIHAGGAKVMLTPQVVGTLTRLVRETEFGSLIFIIQDSRIVQIERNEKYQFPSSIKKSSNHLRTASVMEVDPLPGIKAALAGLHFGQVMVKIQDGRIVQIDRTEKKRIPDLMGLAGEGI